MLPNTKRAVWSATALTMLIVAGCRKAPEEPTVNDHAVEQVAPKPAPSPPVKAPVAAPKVQTPKPKAAPIPSPEQQVLDDADATGMTARVSRGTSEEAPSSDGNSQR